MMRILYRKGNREQAWGISFDYAEFDDAQVDAALAAGWVRNPLELKKQDPEQETEPESEQDPIVDALSQSEPTSEPDPEQIDTKDPKQESEPLPEFQGQISDAGSNDKLSAEEAKAYLDSIGVSYDGIHWKAIVKLAKEHQLKGENQ